MLQLLWLLAAKKKKLQLPRQLLLLRLHQHLHRRPLLHLLQRPLPPLLAPPYKPLPLLVLQLMLPKSLPALLAMLLKKQLTRPKKLLQRNNFSSVLKKPPYGGFFTPVVFPTACWLGILGFF